jgi:hypothetical protein
MAVESRPQAGSTPVDPGPFLAKVVSHLDPTYMGCLEVQVMREVGGDVNSDGQLTTVKYLNPFYGVTGAEHVTDTDDYNNTQKSYGMWFVPPDPGSLVVVIFIGGDPRKGYWIGCVQDEGMNFMVPGLAATEYVVGDTKTDDSERVPVAEYNKIANQNAQDPTKRTKPQHPITEFLIKQGLILDDTRGITTSSARREVPSAVFGISTPGPVDKNGKRGKVGKAEHLVDGAFVSRLGGSTFVMDDGNDKFIRKTPPSDGPPEYSNLLNGETDGDNTIPHNECIRFRTRTGHQILLHNSEDLIYIGNSKGTAWIELTSDGKIDIFAEDSISVHTKQDLNFFADRDINLECVRNMNIKVGSELHTHVMMDQILIVDGKQKIHVKQEVDKTYELSYKQHVKKDVEKLYDENHKITVLKDTDFNTTGHNWFTAGKTTEIKSGGNHIETAALIHMNGPTASEAVKATEAELPQRLKLHTLPDQDELPLEPSIMRRIITHEPYPHHENLDPLKVKPEQTDRDIEGRYEDTDEEQLNDQEDFSVTMLTPASSWKTYSTAVDPFRKLQSD